MKTKKPILPTFFITHCLIVSIILITGTNIMAWGNSIERIIKNIIEESKSIETLSQYADSPEVIRIKLANMFQINKERQKYGLPQVQFDILASRVANKHCAEMLENDYLGHWNTKGYKPYHRYAFAGGTDHVEENLSGQWYRGGVFETDPKSVLNLMNEDNQAFITEQAPYDSHKKVILKPYHTHVGIGYAIKPTSYRYAQLFVDRYLTVDNFPNKSKKGQAIKLTGKILSKYKDYGPYAIAIYYDPINKQFDYNKQPDSYPDYSDTTFRLISPWNILYDREMQSFSTDISFEKANKGLYYFIIYVRDRVDTIPYIPKPGETTRMNTKDAIPAGGIVIEIE